MGADSHVFLDLGLLFAAALLFGGLASWLRQPLILGYLVAGIAVGPFTPGPTLSDPTSFQIFADVAVVLLMFSIGLEFSLGELMRVRNVAMFGTPLGVTLIISLTWGIGCLLGWPSRAALVLGASLCAASSMVLLKFLAERGEVKTSHGRVILGISLAGDLTLVVLTTIVGSMGTAAEGDPTRLVGALVQSVLLLAPLLWLSRRVVPGLLERAARTQNMELFLLTAMTVAIGTATVTASLGLSIALGAFLAGLVISESEFAHETLARVLPMRDLFVAVFFVSMGTLIPPQSLLQTWPMVLVLVLIVAVVNAVIWATVVRLFRYPTGTAVLVGLGLSQIGEFSYVLMAVGRAGGLVTDAMFQAMLTTSVVTIFANSLLFRGRPAWLEARLRARVAPTEAPGPSPHLAAHAIICGFGRVGREVADALDHFDVPYAVVDVDPDVTAGVRGRGRVAIFGDAGHPTVLETAGLDEASLVIVAMPSFDAAARCVQTARRLNATVPILVRVHQGRYHARMMEAGATRVVQPEIEAGLALIRHSLDTLGLSRPGWGSPEPRS